MTFDEYQKGVMRTASGVCTATKDNMLLNGIMGAAGEAGERHEVGTQCNGCVNLLRGKTWFMGAEVEEKICKLDVKCKDRKESNL